MRVILVFTFVFSAASALAVTIPTVLVGNPGNAPDPATDGLYGRVDYPFRIGTTEITVEQYSEFLNAVAKTDTYTLYSSGMANDQNTRGIARSGTPGNYFYSVMDSPNKPVAWVTWASAARFANWLQNGQPTGMQDVSTTERGAYSLDGANSQQIAHSVTRNPGAKWFIPTENEWYKSAYHQPAAQGGDVDNYWTYPTRSNNKPHSDQPPGDPVIQSNVANIVASDGIDNGYDDGFAVSGVGTFSSTQNYLTNAGAYTSAPSFYGTYDQGGNVLEWNETKTGGISAFIRGIRGGGWEFDEDWMRSYFRYDGRQALVSADFGFRIATVVGVPEPSALFFLIIGLATVFTCRTHSTSYP
jgi:formylglycine-generating enzyme